MYKLKCFFIYRKFNMRYFSFIIIYTLFINNKIKACSEETIQYEPIQLLGRGAYGHVIQARNSPHVEVENFAIKIIEVKKEKREKPEDIEEAEKLWNYENSQVKNEVDILKKCNHYNTVKLLYYESEFIKSVGTIHKIYFELSDTDLSKIISIYKKQSKKLSVKHRSLITYQILLGLNHLKSRNILHKDLKPSNILIDHNIRVRIADFGLAEEIDKGSTIQATYFIQTRWYKAPEVLQLKRVGFPIEIWSLGCIMIEITTFCPAFPGDKDKQLIKIIQVLSESIEKKLKKESCYHNDCSTSEINIISSMIKLAPEERITCEEALESSYFSDNKSKEYYEYSQVSSEEQSEPKPKRQKY